MVKIQLTYKGGTVQTIPYATMCEARAWLDGYTQSSRDLIVEVEVIDPTLSTQAYVDALEQAERAYWREVASCLPDSGG